MDHQWYYQTDGTSHGPFSAEELRGRVGPDTLVRPEGMADWVPFKQSTIGLPSFASESPAAPADSPEPPLLPAGVPAAPEIPVEPRRNYLVRHWRGELSVARSYWVNTFLVNAGASLLTKAVTAVLLPALLDLRIHALLFFVVLAAVLSLATWQFVGLVRSSLRSPTADARVWGFIGAGILLIGLSLTSVRQLGPYSREMVSILRGDHGIPRLQLDVHPNGRELEIRGGFPAGSAEQFVRFLQQHPDVSVLHVNSGGGRTRDALVIAKAVQARGMTTVVDTHCASAATLVLLAGKERYAMRQSVLGFHQSGVRGISAKEKSISATNDMMTGYMRTRGVTEEFIRKVLATAHHDMWNPTLQELLDAGILTGVSIGTEFSASRALAEATPEELGENLASEEVFRLLSVRAPGPYREAVIASSAYMLRGDSFMASLQPLRELLNIEFARAMPDSSDEAIDTVVELLLIICDRFGGEYPAEVVALFEGNTSMMDRLVRSPAYPLPEELKSMTLVLASAEVGRPVASPAELEALASKAVLHLQANDPPAFAVLLESNTSGKQSPASVRAFLQALREGLTPAERGKFLRAAMTPG